MIHICEYGCGQEAKYQFKNGKWCCSESQNSCSIMRKNNSKAVRTLFEEIIKYVEKEGYEVLTSKEEYEDIFPKKLRFRCPDGHEFKTRYGDFHDSDSRCPECYNKKRRTSFNDIIKFVEKESYKLLSKEEGYKNQFSYVKVRCPEGHEYEVRWDGFKSGNRCRKCANIQKKLEMVERIKSRYGQVVPNYNPLACKVIDEYGEENNYNFQHAENGGEYHILRYWVDGYDKERNTIIEIDEPAHYDKNGNLSKKDLERQKEISDFLGCKFIRLRI